MQACDCHVHVIGERAAYAMVDARHYTPAPAPVEQLEQHLTRIGFRRAVIVQPSVYGFDNRCLLDALSAMRGAARGIAVLPDDIGEAQLDALDAAGVRGIRLNAESAAERDPQALQRRLIGWSQRLGARGWHIQIYAALDVVASVASSIQSLAVPVVLDHFAMIRPGMAPGDVRVGPILELLRQGAVYIKLSAPYRICEDSAADQTALLALVRRLTAINTSRLLWGSDWPHTNREPGKAAHETSVYRVIDPQHLRDALLRWLPDAQLRQTILVDNPARLYRF